MAVEDHPLWPTWKAALEEMIEAKDRWDQAIAQHGADSVPARNAKGHYGLALHQNHLIADKV